MKFRKDYTVASIVFAITILLVSIFFEDHLNGLDTPLLLAGFAFLVFEHFRQRKIKRDRFHGQKNEDRE